MTKRQRAKLTEQFLQHLPDDFATDGAILFLSPIAHILRGVLVNRSSDPQVFYLEVFVQPLFLPSAHVVLNLGWRLGGGLKRWRIDEQGVIEAAAQRIRDEVVPVLRPIDRPEALITAISERKIVGGSYSDEVVAYALAQGGRRDEAVDALNLLEASYDPSIVWQKEAAARAHSLRETLVTAPDRAQRMLSQWEARTVEKLGLIEHWLGQSASGRPH